MSTAAALPYPQMAQMARMDDKAFTQAERTLSEQYCGLTRKFACGVVINTLASFQPGQAQSLRIQSCQNKGVPCSKLS